MQYRDEEQRVLGDGIFHPPAVSWRVVVDKEGSMWLCDKEVESGKDLRAQGCWNCADLPFSCAARNA
jgi:hypothetical protein